MKSKYPNGIVYPDTYQNNYIDSVLKEYYESNNPGGDWVKAKEGLLIYLAENDLKIGYQLTEYVTHTAPVPIEYLPEPFK